MEDPDNVREEGNYDNDPATAYRQKRQEMAFHRNNTVNAARAKDGVKSMKDSVVREIGGFFSSLKEGLTPEFVLRVQYKKKYPVKIAASEEVVTGLVSRVGDTIEKEKRLHDEKVKRDATRKKKIKKEAAHDHIQTTHTKEARKMESKVDFSAARERMRAQALEKKVEEDNEKQAMEERMEKDQKKLREWREVHWAKESAVRYEEALESKTRHMETVQRGFDQSIQGTYDEWADREKSRSRMQVEAPILSGSTDFPSGDSLGVFGIPKHPGAFHAVGSTGGPKPGLDQADLHPLSAHPQTEFESAVIDMYETEAEVKRNQSLYDVLVHDGQELELAMERMCTVRETVERELRQLQNEQSITDRSLEGPPRRFPAPNEVVATNIRQDRQNAVKAEISRLQHAIDVSDTRKRRIDAQMLTIAKKLASTREALRQQEKDLAEVNGGLGTLPVIVGRNISTVAGMRATAKPLETYHAVTHQSKVIEYDDQSKMALRLHREGVKLDRELWLKKQGSSEVKLDVERTLNKLADISERLKVAHYQSNKLSLIDALRAFQQSLTPLNQTTKKLVGPLCWWKNRKPMMCKAVEAFDSKGAALGGISFDDIVLEEQMGKEEGCGSEWEESSDEDLDDGTELQIETDKSYGVTLKGGKNSGFCVGSVEFPRAGMWNVCLIVSRKGSEDKYFYGDEKDNVIIHMGYNLQNMKEIGVFRNVINPETGAVLYDVKYLVRGKTLAYKFEFASSSLHANHHMIVSAAVYEEFVMIPLETVRIESGRERVLSAYVKTIRLDESQGKMRLTKLIEELLCCEDAEFPGWDSDVIQNYPQRYTREYFLRILRAEILVEQQRAKRATEQALANGKDPFGLEVSGSSSKVGMTQQLYEKLKASEERFIRRKQETQYPLIAKARELVGKRMDIHQKSDNTWRTVLVTNCVVKWVEGGQRVRIRHKVQELNQYNEHIGGIFEADLLSLRAVESPVQDVDEEAIAKLREFRAWERRLLEIDQETRRRLKEAKRIYKKQFSRGARTIQSMESMSVSSFQSKLEVQQGEFLESQKAKDAISAIVPDITDALIRGRIKGDKSMTPDEQAVSIARKRVLSDWQEDQQRLLQRQIARQTSRVKQDVGAVARSYAIVADEIKLSAEKEKATVQLKMKQALQDRKESVMKRVKFKKKDFLKAVPQSRLCEHLKAKAWGDNYGTGVRCQQCGKELTELYLEESQLLGYGTGCDPWMVEALPRHRKNEAAFRFKDSKEVEILEQERLRLEKERREMDLQEEYFYDFQDLKAIYEFDRRHAKELKAQGIFRQGLQWTEMELKYFEATKTIQEVTRLESAGIFSGNVIKDFDPLSMIDNPPPTFRATEERHKAQYRELMYTMGRMSNFNKRIMLLKRERIDLLSDRAMYSFVLCALHKESFVREHELILLEADLERTGKMLATYQRMYKLWANANEILLNAQREKKRAEMRRCGLWEEIKELKDEHTVVRVETRELLKLKFLHDIQIEDLVKALEKGRAMASKMEKLWLEEESHAAAFQYCMPGSRVQHRFGLCEIIMYRHTDQMLMLLLPFGTPRARAWVPAREIINAERNRQHGEQLLMNIEDRHLKEFYRVEKTSNLKELYQMRLEERACRKRWEIEDLQATEEGIVQSKLEKSLHQNFVVTQTTQFNESTKLKVQKEFERRMKDMEARIKNYKGKGKAKNKKPKMPSTWKQWKLKKQIDTEMRKQFILKAASRDKRQALEDIKSERRAYLGGQAVEDLIDCAVVEMMYEIARESLGEGNIAKVSAEMISGIYCPTPVWMQYTTYCLLRDMWKNRKKELKNNIQIGLGSKHRFEANAREEDPSDENALKAAEARRLHLQELKRQKMLCELMEKEEAWSRAFYHWEMKENLRERRLMKEEERLTRNYMKEQEALKASVQNKYAGVSSRLAKQEEKKAGTTDKLRRRNDLKDLTMERRKQREELALMRVEDALSRPLRDVDKRERQKKLLAQQLGLEALQREEEPETPAMAVVATETVPEKSKRRGPVAVEVPEWLTLPRNWSDMNTALQNQFVNLHMALMNYQVQHKQNLMKDEKLLQVIKKKNMSDWTDRSNALNMNGWNAELAYMLADEDCREAENNLIKLKENVRRLTSFCQLKGEEELKLLSSIKEKEEVARKRDRELADASKWLELCEYRSKKRSKLKRRIESDCLWVDTDSVTGFMQRFRTERLRDRLYWSFFREIIFSIICRAEIIATERKLLFAQEGLSQNKALLVTKTALMKDLWREYQREELLRMRRSALNKKFFPRMRRNTLMSNFRSWVRFFYWNRGHREAFEMKYEVLKRKLDVDRQFKQQLSKDADVKAETHSTAMQIHRDRSVECQQCHNFYLESQNTSISCHYHSGSFSIACPKSCTNPGLSSVCIAHKKRRWTCCDSGDPKIIGCARRYHVPVESDPIYDEVMAKVVERDIEVVSTLDAKLAVAADEKWVRRAMDIKRKQVADVEAELKAARDTAARYKNLKD